MTFFLSRLKWHRCHFHESGELIVYEITPNQLWVLWKYEKPVIGHTNCHFVTWMFGILCIRFFRGRWCHKRSQRCGEETPRRTAFPQTTGSRLPDCGGHALVRKQHWPGHVTLQSNLSCSVSATNLESHCGPSGHPVIHFPRDGIVVSKASQVSLADTINVYHFIRQLGLCFCYFKKMTKTFL